MLPNTTMAKFITKHVWRYQPVPNRTVFTSHIFLRHQWAADLSTLYSFRGKDGRGPHPRSNAHGHNSTVLSGTLQVMQ